MDRNARPLRTPRKSAVGLGSAKAGVDHFIKQRVSAVALLIAVPLALFAFVNAYQSGYENARAWLAHPFNAVVMLLTLTAAFYHMRLGLQVVIEDYIAGSGLRAALLIVNTLVAATVWVVCVFSILKVALGA